MITTARLIGISLGFFLGIIVHEFAHAFVADKLGDRSARMAGRLTLKPKAHVDPIGTLAMPALFLIVSLVGQPFKMVFGYGKPLPSNPRAFKKPKRDQIIVALTGPAVNLALAVLGGIGARALAGPAGVLGLFAGRAIGGTEVVALALCFFMSVNVFLLIINLFPIPPLDGSKILATFLSSRAQFMMHEYAQYLLLFLIILFFIFQGVIRAMAAPVCGTLMGTPLDFCPL